METSLKLWKDTSVKALASMYGIDVSWKMVMGYSTIMVINWLSEINFSLRWRRDMTTPVVRNQGFPKSILYGESTLITWKLTMKNLRPISIISSILPCTSRCMPSKALMIVVVGLIRDISTFKRLRVAIKQTFKVDPLSINTLATIMSLHLTTICMAKVWSLPPGGNLSSKRRLGW